jgi:hypothetical protein
MAGKKEAKKASGSAGNRFKSLSCNVMFFFYYPYYDGNIISHYPAYFVYLMSVQTFFLI